MVSLKPGTFTFTFDVHVSMRHTSLSIIMLSDVYINKPVNSAMCIYVISNVNECVNRKK